jgi:hypothetical protein
MAKLEAWCKSWERQPEMVRQATLGFYKDGVEQKYKLSRDALHDLDKALDQLNIINWTGKK